MLNIKYHLKYIGSALVFSYMSAATVNNSVEYALTPLPEKQARVSRKVSSQSIKKKRSDYDVIVNSGFFKISDAPLVGEFVSTGPTQPLASLDTLQLIGTITGPSSIARAMIKKKGEKIPGIFAIRKISNTITNDVYGHKLVSIRMSRVTLEKDNEKFILELYKTDNSVKSKSKSGSSISGSKINKSISRSEIKQKVLNNLDNAMKGIVAGPYRVNGKVEGFRLKRVRPYNILYKLGARSGDIAKRINGHKLDSTEKLYTLWQTIKNESSITVDIERAGKPMTFNLKISD